MKQNITAEQVALLTAEEILTLANHPLIETVWSGWDTLEKVQESLNVYQEKGWKHSSLINTAIKCNITNLLDILSVYGKINIENLHTSSGITWRVNMWVKPFSKKTFISIENVELIDALWGIMRNICFDNQFYYLKGFQLEKD